ncbi:MAG: hypothetical protein K2L25_02525 [Alphaproteobacteria bacterium]|nr:hypothetical protein [Alphaproteobacteria bacterium]
MNKRFLFYVCVAAFVALAGNRAYGAIACKVYSCNVGYFASEYSCPRCPALQRADGGMQYGITASAGLSDITACYVPAGVKYKDAVGEFEFVSNCNYSR